MHSAAHGGWHTASLTLPLLLFDFFTVAHLHTISVEDSQKEEVSLF